jgi:Uri superfamily endonuclease
MARRGGTRAESEMARQAPWGWLRHVTEVGAGTYILVMWLDHEAEIQVGRLGQFCFAPGWYLYVGSALGPGGLTARVARHARAQKRLHWHVDYLLARAVLREVWAVAEPVRRECDWARALAALAGVRAPVSGFGASDCGCETHLFLLPERPQMDRLTRVLGAHYSFFGISVSMPAC